MRFKGSQSFLRIPGHGYSADQRPGTVLLRGQEETCGAVRPEPDLQRQEQDPGGGTLACPHRERGPEGTGTGGRGLVGARGRPGRERKRRIPRVKLDPGAAADGSRLRIY